MTPLNPWQYVTPLRVKDVYGHWMYISQEHFDNLARILIPICRKDGLRRIHTKAGRDRQNMLHRANIAFTKSLEAA